MDDFLMALEEAVDCFQCGETGHFSRDCPQAGKPQTQKGKDARQKYNADRREKQATRPRAQGGFTFKGFQKSAQPPKPAPDSQEQTAFHTQSTDHDLIVALTAKVEMLERQALGPNMTRQQLAKVTGDEFIDPNIERQKASQTTSAEVKSGEAESSSSQVPKN